MKRSDRFKFSCSRTIERIFARSAAKPTEQQLTLKRKQDGTLTFLTGNPVRASELIPGKQYTVIAG